MAKIEIGKIYSSNNYGDFKVNDRTGVDKYREIIYEIEFINTNYKCNKTSSEIRKGIVKDYFYPIVYGIGYLGCERNTADRKIYKCWNSMLERCYSLKSPAYINYGEKNIVVDERWHNFNNFQQDIKELEGWNEELFYKGSIDLDKDILSKGKKEKIYSKDFCIWVSRKENCDARQFKTQKEFTAISPTGTTSTNININEFAKINNLSNSGICDCLNGKRRKHKGWLFKYIESVAK